MAEEYKFPDEQDEARKATAEPDIQVEVEDDTPPEDRNKAPLPRNMVEELERDDLDEYSDKVKKRLSQMKKVWHDERREKERAVREREEALRFAQARESEIRQLKQRLGYNERAFIKEAEKAANNELNIVKDKLKQAYDSGDSDKIAEAQEKLTDVKLKLQNIARARPSLQESEEGVEPETEQVTTPQYAPEQADPKAEAWRQKNTWFGVDEEMTALALGLHEKLVRAGIDPRSDDYYRRVDETMRKRFPESFEGAEDGPTQTREGRSVSRNTKPATVVAPVTRSTAPRQVRLTSSQVAIAKKLGLSNEQYARELMKLETYNG